MNILVVSEASWNNTNSFGNTVSNWFEDWEGDHFFSFYTRKQIPENKVVEMYYNVSAIEVIKEFLGRKVINKCFSSEDIDRKAAEQVERQSKEQKQIDRLHKKKREFVYFVMEQVWLSKVWIKEELKRFIDEEAKPDILFAFATSPFVLLPLIKYVKKKNKKIVLFIADDVYSAYSDMAWYRRKYLQKTFCECIQYADRLYGASKELCDVYGKQFDKIVSPLYKGGRISFDNAKKGGEVLKFVYAGNLLYGREEVLCELAKVLKEINKDETKAVLEIYTGTTLTPRLEDMLHVEGTSFLMGARSYDEIKNILKNADVVLHVESFEKKQIDCVHLSLSTKIVDCLQCGSGVLGIGPKGIASIEYIRRIPGTYVIDDIVYLKDRVQDIVINKRNLPSRIMKIREFASTNHDIDVIRKRLKKEFEELLT